MNNSKLEIQDSLNQTIGDFNFKTYKVLKNLYGCDFELNQNQKLILIIDSRDSILNAFCILNNKASKFKNTISCFDYELGGLDD